MYAAWVVLLVGALALSACQGAAARAEKTKAPPSRELTVDAALLNSGRIQIEPVLVASEPIDIRTSGKGAFNQDHLSYVSAQLVGRVLEIVAQPGEPVVAGQTLATLDSPDLGQASSELIKARADLVLAERSFRLAQELTRAKAMAEKDFQQAQDGYVKAQADVRRVRERLLSLGVPSSELDAPLEALHVRSRLELRAPIAGTVIERTLTVGQIVGADPAPRLFVIADLSHLWVTADIYEKDLPYIHPGDTVSVQAAPWPDTTFTGTIAYVSDTVDPTTRTIKLRLDVDNEARRLKPEMFVTATVHTQRTATVLSVPLSCVHGEGLGQPYVFVALAANRLAPRPVTLGDRLNGRVVVTAGLSPADRVVTEGSILLRGEGARTEPT